MITEIGITAGDIWHVLERHSSRVLKDLCKEIDASRDQILMSLGWLAREGHVSVEVCPNNEYVVTLINRKISS